MASRKDLKKSVKAISDYYASAANFLQNFSDSSQQEKLTEIIVELYNLENESLKKLAESKKSDQPLKKYFRQLVDEHNQLLDKIEEKLSTLEGEIFKDFTSTEDTVKE
ncbi:hypothetical protein HMPREF1869_00687 [Bacteroidales bacterium KA00251]|nr:hypothetical protein HMPREF1869_00687 [Bacteroidales bacterium KA00251]